MFITSTPNPLRDSAIFIPAELTAAELREAAERNEVQVRRLDREGGSIELANYYERAAVAYRAAADALEGVTA